MLTPFSYQGSKLKEISKLSPYIPNGSNIVEPFLGSGIVTMKLGGNFCLANDFNRDLVEVWNSIDNPDFIDRIRNLCSEENRYQEYYYKNRDIYNQKYLNDIWDIERTSLFYYLMMSCHAGMIRYGPNGFNTSFKLYLANGRYYNIEERILTLKYIKEKLGKVYRKFASDFLKDLIDSKEISKYDIVYCDPPYINSASSYVDSWNIDDLLELDSLLYYINDKFDKTCVLSNYFDNDVKYSGQIIHHTTSRMASTKVVEKNDVIVIYSSNKPTTIESFYE